MSSIILGAYLFRVKYQEKWYLHKRRQFGRNRNMWAAKALAEASYMEAVNAEVVLLTPILISPLLYKCRYIYTDTEKERNMSFKDVTTFNQLKGKENILPY